MSATANPVAKPEIACEYHVARILAVILDKTQGRQLVEEDRLLWKMGYDISGRERIHPYFTAVRDDDGVIDSWSFSPGRLWFPKRRGSYASLWEAMSGGVPYKELLSLHKRDPLSLEASMQGVCDVYAVLLADDARRLPPAFLRTLLMPSWLSRIARDKCVEPLVRCCLEGVPASDVLA